MVRVHRHVLVVRFIYTITITLISFVHFDDSPDELNLYLFFGLENFFEADNEKS
jgi:hypothetical protein